MAKGDMGSFGGVGGGMNRSLPWGHAGGMGEGWKGGYRRGPMETSVPWGQMGGGGPVGTLPQQGKWGGMISKLLNPSGGGESRLQYESPWGTGRSGPISGLFPGMGDRKNQVMPNQDFQQPGGMAQPGLRPMPGWMNSPEDYQKAVDAGEIQFMHGMGR